MHGYLQNIIYKKKNCSKVSPGYDQKECRSFVFRTLSSTFIFIILFGVAKPLLIISHWYSLLLIKYLHEYEKSCIFHSKLNCFLISNSNLFICIVRSCAIGAIALYNVATNLELDFSCIFLRILHIYCICFH